MFIKSNKKAHKTSDLLCLSTKDHRYLRFLGPCVIYFFQDKVFVEVKMIFFD